MQNPKTIFDYVHEVIEIAGGDVVYLGPFGAQIENIGPDKAFTVSLCGRHSRTDWREQNEKFISEYRAASCVR